MLKTAGFKVQGVFMKNWTNSAPNIECTTEKDFADAETVCDQIGIPLHQANFSGLLGPYLRNFCLITTRPNAKSRYFMQ